ncbi:MarR family winged helix-turn-helix transcriptional regulator [Gephyromycinifex aptenodytis]|uniref:MarR family winged helix-turn-helix transcriptional regulator n=1 Tax=Gephyromycinifex aptenodytis TaxID=2716227 RepID=UPI00144855CF|nr:MarR family winged helix-turn-helix transcriptional regulator [Gephyromycinifex aptenodytis]
MTEDLPAAAQSSRLEREQSLGQVLAALSHASTHIEHRFSAHEKLHSTDFRALTAIYVAENEGAPLSASALAAELDLSTGAVTYLVERLVTSGHVQRDKDPKDRRKVILRYAEHGYAVAAGFFGPLAAHTHAALAAHSDAEIEAAIRVITSATAAIRAYDRELADTGS